MNETDVVPYRVPIKIPYCGVASERLKKSLNKLAVKVNNDKVTICFTARRLSSFLQVKDSRIKMLRSSLVYKYQCPADLGSSYIGETKRQLIRRIKDHFTEKSSAICRHIQSCECSNTFKSNFAVLKQMRTGFKLIIMEALLIK